jgi:hypothetical protein
MKKKTTYADQSQELLRLFIRLRRRPQACCSEAEIPPVSAGPQG